jgi:thymidylate kinase
MVILINGSFGVGKTTVAKLLAARIPKSILFDPELIGFVLQPLSKFIPLSGRGTGDFQDILLWRKLTAMTASALKKITNRTIIIPMTFSNLDYLNQIRCKLLNKSITVRHLCLTAPVEVVYERLRKRGVNSASPEGAWIYPRAARCCEIHTAAEFGEHINTMERSPVEIADDIWKRIEDD